MFYINFVLILGNHGNFIVIIIHCNLAIIIVIDCVKIVSQISDILLKQKKLVIIIVSYWLDMNIKTFSYKSIPLLQLSYWRGSNWAFNSSKPVTDSGLGTLGHYNCIHCFSNKSGIKRMRAGGRLFLIINLLWLTLSKHFLSSYQNIFYHLIKTSLSKHH